MQSIEKLAEKFDLPAAPICARKMYGSSRHESWLLDLSNGRSVIIQRIDADAFDSLEALAENTRAVSRHLESVNPKNSRRFVRYIDAEDGDAYYEDKSGCWRAYYYIDRAHSPLPEEPTARDASELACALGAFHRQTADMPLDELTTTVNDLHNSPVHYKNFLALLETAPKNLLDSARDEINFLRKQSKYIPALLKMGLPARVVHNRVDLSRLLLDNETGRAVCLIDYDTVMPGLLCFDFGDAVRSGCRVCRSDERLMKKIRFDLDRFSDMTRLYIDVMRPIFDKTEPASLAPGAIVMALEAGTKYLVDYLTGNEEYPAAYPEQNLYRARVQLMLAMQMQYYYKEMDNIVRRALG